MVLENLLLIAKRIIDLESEVFYEKIIALLMSAILMISLASCGGGGSSTSSESPEKKVITAAENSVSTRIALDYKTQGVPSFDSYVTKNSDTEYTVTGKVRVKDDYGDYYSGKYTVEVEYDPKDYGTNVKDCDLETPTKE